MRRNGALALVVAAGAAIGALAARRRRAPEAPSAPPDDRAEDLRRKLAEARAAPADEGDFAAAGMGAETIVEESAPEEPAPETAPARPEAPPAGPPAAREEPAEPPPVDEFEAMRRRIHEEGRAAAEEMRRSGEPPAER